MAGRSWELPRIGQQNLLKTSDGHLGQTYRWLDDETWGIWWDETMVF